MAGGKGPAQKGQRFAGQMVARFQEAGIAAERIPLSGSSPFGSFSGYDLNVPMFGEDYRVECKHSGNGFRILYGWLEHGQNDFLIVRADRSEPLAVVPLSMLIKWTKGIPK